MTGKEFDKKCSCGELIRFVENPMTGNAIPICKTHGTNHFLDCPDRARYRKQYRIPTPSAQKSLEAFR